MNNKVDTKSWGIGLGVAVYVGVVLLALSFNVGLMNDRFSGLLLLVANIGMIAVALNAFALPLALHGWAVDGPHRSVAIGGYILDILAMIINAVASFSHYMGDAPAWVESYLPYTPAAIMLPIVTWALLFIVDPGNKALVAMEKAKQSFKVGVINKAAEFLETEGGEEVIAQVAATLATKEFNHNRFFARPDDLPTAVNLRSAEKHVYEEALEALDPTQPPSKKK